MKNYFFLIVLGVSVNFFAGDGSTRYKREGWTLWVMEKCCCATFGDDDDELVEPVHNRQSSKMPHGSTSEPVSDENKWGTFVSGSNGSEAVVTLVAASQSTASSGAQPREQQPLLAAAQPTKPQ